MNLIKNPAGGGALRGLALPVVALVLLGSMVMFAAGCSDDEKQLTPDDFATTQPKTQRRFKVTRPAQDTTEAAGVAGVGPLEVVDPSAVPSSANLPAESDEDVRRRAAGDRAVENTLAGALRPVIKSTAVSEYTLDAMVGQVNGNPIYASTVFDPISKQLERQGRDQTRLVFQQNARGLIRGRLEEIIYNALILGVAERDLSDVERKGLEVIMKDHRDELIRKYGMGSLFLADENALSQTGKTIEQLMQDFRASVLINRYYKQKLLVKVHVSRRDVQRFYLDNYSQFNQAPGRRIRMIRTPIENSARFEAALKSGKPFKDVATDPKNLMRPSEGGLYPDVVSGTEFAEQINEAVLSLKTGQYTGPIRTRDIVWWVYCEQEIAGVNRPLRDVQLLIEEELRKQRIRVISEGYQAKLFSEGSYGNEASYNRQGKTAEGNSRAVEEMVNSLMSVATARYAQPQAQAGP